MFTLEGDPLSSVLNEVRETNGDRSYPLVLWHQIFEYVSTSFSEGIIVIKVTCVTGNHQAASDWVNWLHLEWA
jgi:hypothetical protein